jgi:hypothetical protein
MDASGSSSSNASDGKATVEMGITEEVAVIARISIIY